MAVICLDPTELTTTLYSLYLADVFADLVTIDVSGEAVDPDSAPKAIISGGAAAGDLGGGTFVYLIGSTLTVNGASVSASSTGVGRWVAVHGIQHLTLPGSVAAEGQVGDYFVNGFYRYECIANATWRRMAHGTF